MKMQINQSYLFLFLLLAMMVACQQAPEADKATVEDAKEVEERMPKPSMLIDSIGLNVAQSTITWVGTKPTGQHNGTMKLKSGMVMVEKNVVTGGNFIIDVTSLNTLDMDEKNNADLSNHLKSADFFDVEKFPEAKFDITKIIKYTASTDESAKPLLKNANSLVTGNLTLKGVTKSISFPAIVSMSKTGKVVKAKANFNIDRTQWGLTYGSDKSLGDRFIRPTVNIGFEIRGGEE